MEPPPAFSPLDLPVANCLRIDAATVQAVDALHEAGVDAILLKGPVVAQWLYGDDPIQRRYGDADLLVDPGKRDAAREVLAGLGYQRASLDIQVKGHSGPRHAECWLRTRDVMAVDLHTCIHGTEQLDPRTVWDAARASAGTIDLLGHQVATPGEAFRLLHVVLQAGPADRPGTQARTDLDRAVGRVSFTAWQGAADLARRLGVHADFGARLATAAGGADLASRLGLPATRPLSVRLDYSASTSATRTVGKVLRFPWRSRIGVLARWLVPPPSYLRNRFPRTARRPGGLALAYLYRPMLLPWRVVQVLRDAWSGRGRAEAGTRDDRGPTA